MADSRPGLAREDSPHGTSCVMFLTSHVLRGDRCRRRHGTALEVYRCKPLQIGWEHPRARAFSQNGRLLHNRYRRLNGWSHARSHDSGSSPRPLCVPKMGFGVDAANTPRKITA